MPRRTPSFPARKRLELASRAPRRARRFARPGSPPLPRPRRIDPDDVLTRLLRRRPAI